MATTVGLSNVSVNPVVGGSDPVYRKICQFVGMTNTTTLGQRVQALRKSRGMTQVDAAEAIGIARSSLASIETDHDMPGRETLGAIATFYGVSLDTLLPSSAPVRGDLINDPDELAWLRLWRRLDDSERAAMLKLLGGRGHGTSAA